jgi:multiple sugar transport system permease protein
LRIPPTIFPEKPVFDNFFIVWNFANLGRAFLNSLIVSLSTIVLVILSSSIAGFAFAKYNFKGRNLFFMMLLSTLILPFFITLIPNYLLITWFGWQNSYWALIIPFCVSSYGIFLMRQYVSTIPDELLDSARVDGSSEIRIFWSIVLPLCKPAMSVLALWTFLTSWNSFFWPFIVISSKEMYTIPLALISLQKSSLGHRLYHLCMAGVAIATIPLLIFAIILQKWLIKGMSGALGLKL